MLSRRPTLSIYAPTHTTIQYTVTTEPEPTITIRLIQYFVGLTRYIIGLSLLLICYSKYTTSSWALPSTPYAYESRPEVFSFEIIWYSLSSLLESPLGSLASEVAARLPGWAWGVGTFIIFHFLLIPLNTTEDLLVIRGSGIQTTTSPNSYLSCDDTRFIPTTQVQDIVINEVFIGFEVRHCLTVIVKDEEDLVIVFPIIMPGRDVVEKVYRSARKCLWGDRKEFDDKKSGESPVVQVDGADDSRPERPMETLHGVNVVRGDRDVQVQA